MVSRSPPRLSRATSNSKRAWRPSQNSGLQPRNRESRSAAAAVMGRTPASISTTSGSGTRSPSASQAGDFPRGARKSSRRVSPGWIYDNRASRSLSSLMGWEDRRTLAAEHSLRLPIPETADHASSYAGQAAESSRRDGLRTTPLLQLRPQHPVAPRLLRPLDPGGLGNGAGREAAGQIEAGLHEVLGNQLQRHRDSNDRMVLCKCFLQPSSPDAGDHARQVEPTKGGGVSMKDPESAIVVEEVTDP